MSFIQKHAEIQANLKRFAEIIAVMIGIGFLVSACALVNHAWKSIRIKESGMSLAHNLNPSEVIVMLDLQLENAKAKMKQLDPGPPPAWYKPSYYYDWLPRAEVYNQAQETFVVLQKQKRIFIEKGRQRVVEAGEVWNFGIAPILHFLLSLTLILAGIRLILRLALVKGIFGWVKL